MSDIDLTEAAANALRTAWLNGKSNTTEGWSLHGEADRLVEYIREQVAREIEAHLPAALVADMHSHEGWASDMQTAGPHSFDGEWVGFCGQGSVDVRHIAEYAARIARGED